MKTMRSRAVKTFLYPKQVYCFKKVTDSLTDLINKTNFMENCEKWRNSSTQLPDNVLGDCFEGRVWKELQYVDGEPFLAISNNFGLMLNVDWFQPTLHGSESIGVIYMVVMNFQERNASNLKILLYWSIKCCLRHILKQPFRILIYPFQTTGPHSLKGLLLGLLIL